MSGVLGVLCPDFMVTGSSFSVEETPRALTRATVGLLRGSKVKGGKRNGCKLFCRRADAGFLESMVGPMVRPRFLRVSGSIFGVDSPGPIPVTDCRDLLAGVLC